jgi:hypothetical protein
MFLLSLCQLCFTLVLIHSTPNFIRKRASNTSSHFFSSLVHPLRVINAHLQTKWSQHLYTSTKYCDCLPRIRTNAIRQASTPHTQLWLAKAITQKLSPAHAKVGNTAYKYSYLHAQVDVSSLPVPSNESANDIHQSRQVEKCRSPTMIR